MMSPWATANDAVAAWRKLPAASDCPVASASVVDDVGTVVVVDVVVVEVVVVEVLEVVLVDVAGMVVVETAVVVVAGAVVVHRDLMTEVAMAGVSLRGATPIMIATRTLNADASRRSRPIRCFIHMNLPRSCVHLRACRARERCRVALVASE